MWSIAAGILLAIMMMCALWFVLVLVAGIYARLLEETAVASIARAIVVSKNYRGLPAASYSKSYSIPSNTSRPSTSN